MSADDESGIELMELMIIFGHVVVDLDVTSI